MGLNLTPHEEQLQNQWQSSSLPEWVSNTSSKARVNREKPCFSLNILLGPSTDVHPSPLLCGPPTTIAEMRKIVMEIQNVSSVLMLSTKWHHRKEHFVTTPPGLRVAHVVPWSVPIFVHCPLGLKCIPLTHFTQQDRLQETEPHGSILSLPHGEPPPLPC